MPYKDPERKRQWEREHRAQRNAQRKTRRSGTSHTLADVKPVRELGSNSAKDKAVWKSLVALAIGLGVIVLGAVTGVSTALPSNMHGAHE